MGELSSTNIISYARECLDDYFCQKQPETKKFLAVLQDFEPALVQKDHDGLKGMVSLYPGTHNNFTRGKDYEEYLLLYSAFQNAGNALFLIDHYRHTPPDDRVEESFISVIQTMRKVAINVPLVANEIKNLEVIKRASQWELACSFRFLYQWHTTIGPALIGPLVKLYTEGKRIKNPGLALLVGHVVAVAQAYTGKRSNRESSQIIYLATLTP